MVIERNGKTITLTPEELVVAYLEQERIFLRDDVVTALDDEVAFGLLSREERDMIIGKGDAIDLIVDLYLKNRDCNIAFNDTIEFYTRKVLAEIRGEKRER